MKGALWILRTLTAGLVLTLFSQLALWCGPDAEARFAPVLENQVIRDVVRFEREACFTWGFDKVRPARAVDANWTLRAGDRIFPYQAVRHEADSLGERRPGALVDRGVAPGQWTRKCIAIPDALAGQPFRITGFVEYATRATGRVWTVRQPTASGGVP